MARSATLRAEDAGRSPGDFERRVRIPFVGQVGWR